MPRRIIHKVNGRALTGALIGAVLVLLAAIGWAYYDSTQRIDKNTTALTALCAQRDDLDQQIAVTDTFLHPKTAKQRRQARRLFAAIPRQVVVDGQRRSMTTRQNLSILDC